MQESQKWRPPTGVLAGILRSTERVVNAIQAQSSALRDLALAALPAPAFEAALRSSAGIAIIAEIKRRSPSKGEINSGISAVERALAYQAGGASAVSVLTEAERFGGSLADLEEVCTAVTIPVLRKDFLISDVQLYEARASGASAALLICRAVPPDEVLRLAAVAAAVGLEVLVEIRDERELETALQLPSAVIGVNSRDLETLHIDASRAASLIAMVPSNRVAVFESGVQSREDVTGAAQAGADAVLVGSVLSASSDPTVAVQTLSGIPKAVNGRRG